MRHSGLVIAVLLVVSTSVCAQHYSGGSSSGSSSHSGASFTASPSSVSSSSGSALSHTASAGPHNSASASSGSRNVPAKSASDPSAATEKRHLFSLPWHKKAAPQFETARWERFPCVAGRTAMCTAPRNASCRRGQTWNGFSCSAPNWQFNDCTGLASQVEAQRRHMQGLNDPGQSLVYETLRNQYQSCLSRGGRGAFGFYALSDFNPFYIP